MNRTQIIADQLPQPMALTQYEDFLYWADWQKQTIERATKVSGTNRTTINDNMKDVIDLSVFHESRQRGIVFVLLCFLC